MGGNSRMDKEGANKRLWRIAIGILLCLIWIGCVHAVYRWATEPDADEGNQAFLEIQEITVEQEDLLAEGTVISGKEASEEETEEESQAQQVEASLLLTPEETTLAGKGVEVADIPAYVGEPFVVINDNIPYFADEEMSQEAYEYYSPLDELGRCGVCVASVGIDIMPTEDRGSIGSVKPTGWVNNKYPDVVDGSYIYNRCHLIGFQLTGENANKGNLITGTRYINIEGMLPFENMVADFVKETGYHVMYRITPVFEGDNLLASGVLMEAKSVEDDGEGILFNVYCYNVQPGIEIDYATGENRLAK